MNLVDQLIETGFDPEKDAPLFDYAERWLASNAFLEGVDLRRMFLMTVGYQQYMASGTVPPEDD